MCLSYREILARSASETFNCEKRATGQANRITGR
jgi:hypothetical protein